MKYQSVDKDVSKSATARSCCFVFQPVVGILRADGEGKKVRVPGDSKQDWLWASVVLQRAPGGNTLSPIHLTETWSSPEVDASVFPYCFPLPFKPVSH